MPHLLRDRTAGQELVGVVIVPIVFGIVTGVVLGESETAYLVLQLLGILGGFFAGLEHETAGEGFYRGLLGGLEFGAAILIAHGVRHVPAAAQLPDPEAMLVAITAVFGAGLGALGGRVRGRRLARAGGAGAAS